MNELTRLIKKRMKVLNARGVSIKSEEYNGTVYVIVRYSFLGDVHGYQSGFKDYEISQHPGKLAEIIVGDIYKDMTGIVEEIRIVW